jgi:inner membrane protein
MVWGLVKERESAYRSAKNEIGRSWGGPQRLAGPFLTVPVTVEVAGRTQRDTQGRAIPSVSEPVSRTMMLTPDTLSVESVVEPETRKRGIYEAVVYGADLDIAARFTQPSNAEFPADTISVDWSRAKLVVLLSDVKGIETVMLESDGANGGKARPGTGLSGSEGAFHFPVDLSDWAQTGASKPVSFDLSLAFKGSQRLMVAPISSETRATMTSPWPHPSFTGDFLPSERSIDDSGFSAEWAVPQLARSIPAVSVVTDPRSPFSIVDKAGFGTRFYQPIDHYRYVDRAAKYGILFIGVTFLVIFTIEILSGGRMHLVHYTMTGLMVLVFYVLLLAIAEYGGFALGYGLATGAVIAGFVASMFEGRAWTYASFGSFAALYGLLYVILSLEDVALLSGAIVGFVMLTVMMFATRKVDWSASSKNKQLVQSSDKAADQAAAST